VSTAADRSDTTRRRRRRRLSTYLTHKLPRLLAHPRGSDSYALPKEPSCGRRKRPALAILESVLLISKKNELTKESPYIYPWLLMIPIWHQGPRLTISRELRMVIDCACGHRTGTARNWGTRYEKRPRLRLHGKEARSHCFGDLTPV